MYFACAVNITPIHAVAISSPQFISVFFSKSVCFILSTTFTAKQVNLQLYIVQHTKSQQLSLLLLTLGWDSSMNRTILCPYSTNFFTFHFSSCTVQAEFFFCLHQPEFSSPTQLLPPPTISHFQLLSRQVLKVTSYFISAYWLFIYSNSPTYLTKYESKADIFKREKLHTYLNFVSFYLKTSFLWILSTLTLFSKHVSYFAYTLESREVS